MPFPIPVGRRPRSERARKRVARAAVAAAAVGLVSLVRSAMPLDTPSTPVAAEEETRTDCPFCLARLGPSDLCDHCGRIARLIDPSSPHRFWADAPYIFPFPPFDGFPTVTARLGEAGLAGETVEFTSGDRFVLESTKKHTIVRGRIGVPGSSSESKFEGEMVDVLDAEGRLTGRQILGRVQGEPDYHVVRSIDYVRSDGGIRTLRYRTSLYRKASDPEKRPASWARHSVGEILIGDERIEVRHREGRRGLRGEPEYASPRIMVWRIVRTGDLVSRVEPVPGESGEQERRRP